MPEAAPLLVYVVDDDAAIRDSLALVLGLGGYSTRLFPDAESFLAAFDEGWTGCVVADVRLPGMSGLELARRLRRGRHAQPVIVVTAYATPEVVRELTAAGVIECFPKPFPMDALRRAVHRALDESSRRPSRQRRAA